MRKLYLIIGIMFFFSLNFSLANPYSFNLYEGDTVIPEFNYSINVNNSDHWVTNEGILDNVADILHNWLSNLGSAESGHFVNSNSQGNEYNLTNWTALILNGGEPITWNPDERTLSVATGIENVTRDLSAEFMRIRKNGAGQTIYNGQLVYTKTVQGERIIVDLADSNASVDKIDHIGMVTQESCNNNADCAITYLGDVKGLKTLSTFNTDSPLYLKCDGSGNFTNVMQTGNCYNIHIGHVKSNSSSNGIIDFHVEMLDIADNPKVNNFEVFNNLTIGKYLKGIIGATDLDILQYNQTDNTWHPSSIETIYYNATSYEVVEGTYNGGTIEDTQHPNGDHDDITLNFSETTGSPALDLRFNFTNGIEDITDIIIRLKTSDSTQELDLQLYNFNSGTWEDYLVFQGTNGKFQTPEFGVFDSTDHVQNGTVSLRLYHPDSGNVNHEIYIDWLAVAKGLGVPVGQEVDPESLHKDGTTKPTGDFDWNGFTIFNAIFNGTFNGVWNGSSSYVPYSGANSNLNMSGQNITADYFFGNISQATGFQTITSNVTTKRNIVYWAEESGSASIGYKLSWGNGDEAPSQGGAILPMDCELTSLGVTTSTGYGLRFRIYKNAVNVAEMETWGSGTKSHHYDLPSPVSFSKGDVLDFYTSNTGTGVSAGYRTFANLECEDNTGTVNITGLKGEKGDKGADGTVSATSGINFSRVTSVSTPSTGYLTAFINDTDGQLYAKNSSGTYYALGGESLADLIWQDTGGLVEYLSSNNIDMNSKRITGLPSPSANSEPTTKSYVDGKVFTVSGDYEIPNQKTNIGIQDGSVLHLGYEEDEPTGSRIVFGDIVGPAKRDGYVYIGEGPPDVLEGVASEGAIFRGGPHPSSGVFEVYLGDVDAIGVGDYINISDGNGYFFGGLYSDAVGATRRDLYVDNTGKIGYVSSSERYKENIKNLTTSNVTCLEELIPVIYDRKDGSKQNEIGLIAEQVNEVCPQFVSYKIEPIYENVTEFKKTGEYYNETYFDAVLNKTVNRTVAVKEWRTRQKVIGYNQTNIPETVLYSEIDRAMLLYNLESNKNRKDVEEHLEFKENLTIAKNSFMAENYITNTTKDNQTISKIESFRETLKTKTFQQVKDFVIDSTGKLSDNILMDTEISNIGSYNLGAIAHFNRAMVIFLMKENLNQQEEIQELKDKEAQRDACWDLNTQAEIIACMRAI